LINGERIESNERLHKKKNDARSKKGTLVDKKKKHLDRKWVIITPSHPGGKGRRVN